MDAAIRRSVKKRRDAEAAEELVKHLEAMGYNLNSESFITKGSSLRKGQFERYAAVRSGIVFTSTNGKASKYDSEGSDEDSSDDEDYEYSSDSEDSEEYSSDSDRYQEDDDEEDETSSEEEVVVERKQANLKSSKKKKNLSAPKGGKKKNEGPQADTRDLPTKHSRSTKKAAPQYFKPQEELSISIGPSKRSVAIPVTTIRKRSGLGRLFKREKETSRERGEDELQSDPSTTTPHSRRNSSMSNEYSSINTASTGDKSNLSKDWTNCSARDSERDSFASSSIMATAPAVAKSFGSTSMRAIAPQENKEKSSFVPRRDKTLVDEVSDYFTEEGMAADDSNSNLPEFDMNVLKSESTEVGPHPSSILESVGSIKATSTMMNEGALEIPLKSSRATNVILESASGTSGGNGSSTSSQLEERFVNIVGPTNETFCRKESPKEMKSAQKSTASRRFGGLGNILRRQGRRDQSTEETKQRKYDSKKHPNAKLVPLKPPLASTEYNLQPHSVSQNMPSETPQLPSEGLGDIVIEGMSLVDHSQLINDQAQDDRLVKVVDVVEQEEEPILIRSKQSPSPPRRRFGVAHRGRSRSPFHQHVQVSYETKSPDVDLEEEVPVDNPSNKKAPIGKLFGKIFPRKERNDKTTFEMEAVGENGPEVVMDASNSNLPNGSSSDYANDGEENNPVSVRTPKSVAFADKVEISDEVEHVMEIQNPSTLKNVQEAAKEFGEFLAVEIDNEANHPTEFDNKPQFPKKPLAADIANALDSIEEESGAEVVPLPEKLSSITEENVDNKSTANQVSSMVATLGDFMRTLAVSDDSVDANNRASYKKKSSDVKVNDSESSKTVDTLRLQSDYPTSCSANPDEENKGTATLRRMPCRQAKAMKSVSAFEGLRLKITSPTLGINVLKGDDMSFTPARETLSPLPKQAPNKQKTSSSSLKSALRKTPTQQVKANEQGATVQPTTLSHSVQSSPQASTVARKPSILRSVAPPAIDADAPHENKQPTSTSPIVQDTTHPRSTPKSQTRPQSLASSNVPGTFPLSPQESMIAVADPLSPSSLDDEESDFALSYLKKRQNLTTWAEVNKAANVLGKAMNHVNVNQSADTTEEVHQIQRILSNDSVGDVETALKVLKRHARRLGVPESDLLLATVKSEDTEVVSEIVSVRSLTLGEELIDMMSSYFQRR